MEEKLTQSEQWWLQAMMINDGFPVKDPAWKDFIDTATEMFRVKYRDECMSMDDAYKTVRATCKAAIEKSVLSRMQNPPTLN